MFDPRWRWYALVLVAAVVGGAWVFWTRVPLEGAGAPRQAAHVNFGAPVFSLAALDGSQVDLEDLRGRVVVVNFWATWCAPCRQEMPALEAAFQAHRGDGLTVLAVNAGEDDNTVAQFVQEFRLTFPVLLDRDGKVMKTYRVQALPTVLLIDREGIVRATSVGGVSRAYLEAQLANLESER